MSHINHTSNNSYPRSSVLREIQDIPLPVPDDLSPYFGYELGAATSSNQNDFVDYSPSHVPPAPSADSTRYTFMPLYRPFRPSSPPPAMPPTITPATVAMPPPLPVGDHNAGHIITPPLTPTLPTRSRGRPKTKFSSKELEELARFTVEVNPFAAKHGEKGDAWKKVAKMLKDDGLCVSSSVDTIKNKMMALLAYHEDPGSRAGSAVARDLSSSSGIKIAALLDRISDMQATAAMQSEEQKEQVRVKTDYDRAGGDAICASSMTTLRRKRQVSTEIDSDSDAENQPPPSTQPPKKKTRRSLSAIAQANSSAGDLEQLKDVIVSEGKRRDENQKEMVETLRESTRVYEMTSEKYLSAILQLSKQQT